MLTLLFSRHLPSFVGDGGDGGDGGGGGGAREHNMEES